MITLFIKGLIIGFAIAAPIGPIGILCIQRSLHEGFKIGLMTGLGAAFADGTCGLVAGFGLTSVSSLLTEHQFWIRLIGGLFLLYLGVKLFLTSSQEKFSGNSERSSWHALSTTFLLTLASPVTILSFVAVFAGLGFSQVSSNYISAIILVLGITLGSAIWWLILSSFVAFILHHRLSKSMMKRINIIAGIIILGFAIFALSMK